jgi:quercetin dioxygenase-like cupin family protein
MNTITGFSSLDDIPLEHVAANLNRKMMSGKQGMVVWWDAKAGAHAGSHSHPNEQLVWVIKGQIDLRIGEEKRTMKSGDIAVILGGVNHEAWFTHDSEVMDIFCPPREDFLKGGKPAYMKA